MTLTQLRTFVAVADAGSVRAAAEALVVSQPAVSSAVAALERELGVDLVEPHGRGLRLTPAGEALAGSARAALGQLDHGVRLARSVADPDAGTVRIAAIATAAERLVLPLLAGFRDEHPGVGVTVRVGNRSVVWDALRGLDADLVVAGRPPAGLPARVLGRAPNDLVVVGRDALTGGARAVVEHLRSATWLVREEGSGTRTATDELLERLGIDPDRMVLGSNGAIEAAVVAGFGVGLLPLDAVRPRLDDGTLALVDCPGTPIARPWHLCAPAGAPLSPTARLVARALLRPGGFRRARAAGG